MKDHKPDYSQTYWCRKGELQDLSLALESVNTSAAYNDACYRYHDLYNNGFANSCHDDIEAAFGVEVSKLIPLENDRTIELTDDLIAAVETAMTEHVRNEADRQKKVYGVELSLSDDGGDCKITNMLELQKTLYSASRYLNKIRRESGNTWMHTSEMLGAIEAASTILRFESKRQLNDHQ